MISHDNLFSGNFNNLPRQLKISGEKKKITIFYFRRKQSETFEVMNMTKIKHSLR